MDQREAPIYEKMKQFASEHPARFHVPGHKGLGDESWPELDAIFPYDVTELEGLDDLADPSGIIADAQRLAAHLYQADETFFLVGGSTAGNLAAVLSVCGPGDLLIVERTVHKSVIHALTLAQAKAVFIQPEVDKATGIATNVSAATLKNALEQYPHAKGVFITRPNYYGMAMPLEEIVKTVHTFDIPLIVDEAHGAHLGFHEKLPQSALAAGADVVVQSTHKMLTSLTMTGMLHIQGKRVDRTEIKKRLSQIQSSSPSYILLASIDLARRRLALNGHALIDQFLAQLDQWKQTMEKLISFELIGAGKHNRHSHDPFKLLIRNRTRALSGFQILEELRKRNVWAEMADPHYALLAFSFHTNEEELYRLSKALKDIANEFSQLQNLSQPIEFPNHYGLGVSKPVDFSQKINSETELVSLEKAVGRNAAEMVIPYPPGIPLLFPGESVTSQTIDTLIAWQKSGARFQHRNRTDQIYVYK